MRKALFIFGILSEEDVDWLVTVGRVRHPEAGEILIRQGVAVLDLYLVLKGHLQVEMHGVGQIARLAAGEIVGEMSFVDAAPPSATVSAEAGALVLSLDREVVTARLEKDLGFAARFYRAIAVFLSDRLRTAAASSAGLEGDELDDTVLDGLYNAGLRFEMVLQRLSARA